jgi:DNA-nicking Smr family endonuclease
VKRRSDRAGRHAADLHLWKLVTATVRPFPGRAASTPIMPEALYAPSWTTPRAVGAQLRPPALVRHSPRAAQAIEPGRLHRLASGRDDLDGRLDLHGLTQDRAKAALAAFVLRGHAEGRRSILVITGKGALGDGVLRRRVPEWLAQAPLRPLVAGLSEAHHRHGGAGALYVALRRNPRG